jgi:hypothetical protein
MKKIANGHDTLERLNPDTSVRPPTDHGVVTPIWYFFDLAHRVQEGGWTYSGDTARASQLS